MQRDIKALREDVVDKKAEKEAPIYVSYICCVVLDYNF